jgi:hypothetical protein
MTLDHTYLTRFAYSNLSRVINSIGWILLFPRKSALGPTSQTTWVVCMFCLSFSHNTTIEALGLSQVSVDGNLLGLLGSFHQHTISTFNTCSWGPTHRSLTDTGGGYNLGGASLPHHTPRPFQSTVLHFQPKGPTHLRLTNQHYQLN